MAYIYLIENGINSHKYVGQTMQSLKTRLQLHWSESKRDCAKHRPLYRAFKKHGIENFKVKILERCEVEELNEREVYWINFFNTFKDPHGYNCTEGGEGGEISEDTKERISEGMKKVNRNEEWVENMSKGLQKKLEKGEKWGFMNGNYDTWSHAKRKIKAIPVLNPSGNCKIFALSDKEMIFNSYTEASEFFGGKLKTSAISAAVKYGWTAYGYKWEKIDKTSQKKKVYGVNRDSGKQTKVFPSIKAAARNWDKRESGLRKSLKKPGERSFMNHYWYYEDSLEG
tara:strand:- start:61 stop:912 length:852 start_codon:yes stop_codon:yes gene_type:complete